jgi:hypothetical protein
MKGPSDATVVIPAKSGCSGLMLVDRAPVGMIDRGEDKGDRAAL